MNVSGVPFAFHVASTILLTSMRTNSDAKNNNVLHSTRARMPSISSVSESMRSNKTPKSAIHPRDKFKFGKLWRKKSMTTNSRVTLHFASNHLSLIGYCRTKLIKNEKNDK